VEVETVEIEGQWPLSAPESYVLENGPTASAAETLKLALTELVATGRLRLVEHESRFLGFTRRTTVLTEGPRRAGPLRPPLRDALALFERTSASGRAAVKKVAQAVVNEHGSLNGYRDRVVMRSLVEAGLFVEEEYRLLWLFTAHRHVVTRSGLAARARLAELQRTARLKVPAGADDPAGATAAAAAVGAALLLTPELFPELRELQRRRGMEADEETAGLALSAADEGSEYLPTATPTAVLEPPSLELSFDFGALDAIGGLDAAMDAIDGGVSDGGGDGGDGGGDGGGGD
jgi:hypothetical protein